MEFLSEQSLIKQTPSSESFHIRIILAGAHITPVLDAIGWEFGNSSPNLDCYLAEISPNFRRKKSQQQPGTRTFAEIFLLEPELTTYDEKL